MRKTLVDIRPVLKSRDKIIHVELEGQEIFDIC